MELQRYNHIASFYDCLSWFLGKSYRESKSLFLEELKEGDKVLYLGGGTGGNLPGILDRIGESGELFYIEASSKMMEKAKSKVPRLFKSRIKFLHQSDFSEIPIKTFDLVLTQYFLDILTDRDLHLLFLAINQRSDKNTRWIFVDFFEAKGKTWLLELMIRFFRIITRYPRRKLPDYGWYFSDYGWEISQKRLLEKGFIQGWLMKKG